jgi:DNA-binding transcriptional LysR family regulator
MSAMATRALPDLSARQLEAVLAVAEYGSFIAASARLRISQPALTRTIKRVETALGVRLFERSTRHVQITPAGREFVAVAERLLNDLRLTVRNLREVAEEQRGRLTLSSIMSVASGVLPLLLATYRADRPGIEIQVREGVHGSVLEDVRSGGADLGLSYVDDLPDAIEGIPLQRETFSVVLPKRHRLASRRSLALTELNDEPMVALPSDSRTRRTIDAAAATAGLSLRQVVTVGQFATLMGCVRAGVGLAVVPTGATAFFLGRDLRAIPVSEPRLSRRLGLITLREREPSPAAAGFMALVRRTWPKQGRI